MESRKKKDIRLGKTSYSSMVVGGVPNALDIIRANHGTSSSDLPSGVSIAHLSARRRG